MLLLFNKKNFGFTVIELLVSATIIIILFSFVLAGFRAGQSSSELSVVVKQLVQSIEEVRNSTLAGKVYQGSFPLGGYGIYFDQQNASQIIPFIDVNGNGLYDNGEEIAERVLNIRNVSLTQICTLNISLATEIPCNGSWQDLSGSDVLAITFPQPGQVRLEPAVAARFVGLTFNHSISGKKAYVYLSLDTGLVTGKALGQQAL